MKKWAFIGLSVLASGAMLVLALPPSGIWIFGWFALTPVFASVRGMHLAVGFLAAFLASIVAGVISVHGWFYLHGRPGGEAALTYLGMALFGAVFAVLSGVLAEVKSFTPKSIVALSALGVLLELVLLQVFPAPLALSQSTVRPMLLLASVTGIWGVGFLIWAFNLALAYAFIERRRWIPWLVGFPVALGVSGWYLDWVLPKDRSLVVGVVQASSMKLRDFDSLTAELGRRQARLAVWPEFGGIVHAPNGDTTKLRTLAAKKGMPAFVTSYRDDYVPKPHNAASLFSAAGESRRYYKRKLFGSESNMHTPGHEPVVVGSTFGRVGLNICFDSCYPAIIRDTARLGADVIALPTIDPGSPYDFFAANHAAFTPFRAAEEGVSIVRCDAYAHSAMVDANGVTTGRLEDERETELAGRVSAHGHWTVYKWAGDWFLYACGAVLLWALPRKRQITESASR